jgi:hypothetical protein
MFAWYQNACVCYVYLSDVQDVSHEEADTDTSYFARSRWFKRGWTLQEMLAPQTVLFYNKFWNEIGDKRLLQSLISKITGIDKEILIGDAEINSASIAERMAWAADRTTSRPEDIAYSLLGIFNVNMSMLYGTGERAFIQLQEEIIKYHDDQSIFAWRDPNSEQFDESGVFATHPSKFANFKRIIRTREQGPGMPFEWTHSGIRISVPLFHIAKNVFAAVLDCRIEPELVDHHHGYPTLILRKRDFSSSFSNLEVYSRISPRSLLMFRSWKYIASQQRKTIFLRASSIERLRTVTATSGWRYVISQLDIQQNYQFEGLCYNEPQREESRWTPDSLEFHPIMFLVKNDGNWVPLQWVAPREMITYFTNWLKRRCDEHEIQGQYLFSREDGQKLSIRRKAGGRHCDIFVEEFGPDFEIKNELDKEGYVRLQDTRINGLQKVASMKSTTSNQSAVGVSDLSNRQRATIKYLGSFGQRAELQHHVVYFEVLQIEKYFRGKVFSQGSSKIGNVKMQQDSPLLIQILAAKSIS